MAMADQEAQDRLKVMAADVRRFRDQGCIVREVHQDTVDVFGKMSSFSNRAVSDTAVVTDAHSLVIRRVFEHPPTVVVVGRKDLRRPIINFLAGEQILPETLDSDLATPLPGHSVSQLDWKTVQIKHGKQSSCRQVFSDHGLLDSYEMTEAGAVIRSMSHDSGDPNRPILDVADVVAEDKDQSLSGVRVEVTLDKPLLENGLEIVSCGTHDDYAVKNIDECIKDRLPFFVFPVDLGSQLTAQECKTLEYLQDHCRDCPVLFVAATPPLCTRDGFSLSTPPLDRPSATQGSPSSATAASTSTSSLTRESTPLHEVLIKHGFFGGSSSGTTLETEGAAPSSSSVDESPGSQFQPIHRFCEESDEFASQFSMFLSSNLSYWLLLASAVLHRLHIDCLTSFIHVAFEMSRDALLTPQRIRYVRTQELKLFKSLMDVAGSKQDELRRMMDTMLETLSPDLREEAATFEFTGVELPGDYVVKDSRTLRHCHSQIKAFVFEKLSTHVAAQISLSIDGLKESLLGTLKRCLQSLEENVISDEALAAGSDDWALVSQQGEIVADAEEAASVSATSKSAIAMSTSTTAALQELLSTVYHLEFNERISQSGLQQLLDRLRNTLRFMPWKSSVCVDEDWRRGVADKQVENLSASRLAKAVCSQFRSNLARAHERFTLALRELEVLHSARLQETDEARAELRKRFAPHIARLALHSTSLRDLIRYGMPHIGHELGRGQYGVVYTCQTWAGKRPVCVKSVVPPDEKHWNDLALEFHYMWSLADHPRIVTLFGSVVDYAYGGGDTPAVLLILERMQRDLHSGIKNGLSWARRLQVACDVIEGIRFLHSQGLIHRDIKLKNVLLDASDRGKLTDLGFCKPEAMMTCSVVGTPIHMAPELFSGKYSVSVDVYAFGILFWYISSNQTRLPTAYDRCHSKDQLWYEVQRGLRPECLPMFDKECWKMMVTCWAEDPDVRPLPGVLYEQLEAMLLDAKRKSHAASKP